MPAHDPDGDDVGVLKSIGVLTANGTDDPTTVGTGLALACDIRVADPITTVGDVSFAGRLGREIAWRRGNIPLTVAHGDRSMSPGARRRPGEGALPPSGAEDPPDRQGPRPERRDVGGGPRRVFETPRTGSGQSTTTGAPTGGGTPRTPGGAGPPPPAGDPGRRERRSPDTAEARGVGTQSDSPTSRGGVDEQADPGPTRDSDDRQTTDDDRRRSGTVDDAAGTPRDTEPAGGSPDGRQPPGTRDRTARLSRGDPAPDRGTGDDPSARATPGEAGVSASVDAGAPGVADPPAAGSGTRERVESLHDVGVLTTRSRGGRRPATTGPDRAVFDSAATTGPDRSHEPGVRRRDRWSPTYRQLGRVRERPPDDHPPARSASGASVTEPRAGTSGTTTPPTTDPPGGASDDWTPAADARSLPVVTDADPARPASGRADDAGFDPMGRREPGVRRRGRWDPTFRRRSSPGTRPTARGARDPPRPPDTGRDKGRSRVSGGTPETDPSESRAAERSTVPSGGERAGDRSADETAGVEPVTADRTSASTGRPARSEDERATPRRRPTPDGHTTPLERTVADRAFTRRRTPRSPGGRTSRDRSHRGDDARIRRRRHDSVPDTVVAARPGRRESGEAGRGGAGPAAGDRAPGDSRPGDRRRSDATSPATTEPTPADRTHADGDRPTADGRRPARGRTEGVADESTGGSRRDSPVWHSPDPGNADRPGSSGEGTADRAGRSRDPRVAVGRSGTATAGGTGRGSPGRRPLVHRVAGGGSPRHGRTESPGTVRASPATPAGADAPRQPAPAGDAGRPSAGPRNEGGTGREVGPWNEGGTASEVGTVTEAGVSGADRSGSGRPGGSSGSQPPVEQSGSPSHVGTTRIGGSTGMPTLTHQTGHSAGQSRPIAGGDRQGVEAADRFPDLDVKRPAPTVDVTSRSRRDGPDERPPPGDGDRGSASTERGERAVEEAFFGNGPDPLASDAEVDRVVDRIYRKVERKMRIERERRGL